MPSHFYDRLIQNCRRDLSSGELPSLEDAIERLEGLRDYREFALLTEVAEAYLVHAPESPELKKLYAQGLIDGGRPFAALSLLRSTLSDLDPDHPEYADTTGILGRAHKDLFLAAVSHGRIDVATRHAQHSFDAYFGIYRERPEDRYYQGINAAALIQLASDEGVKLERAPDLKAIADDLIAALKGTDAKSDPWIEATLAEAHIPLEDWDRVETHLGAYLANPEVTLFQLSGTLRQFRDVWRLERRGRHSRDVLLMLEAGVLRAGRWRGGDLNVSVKRGAERLPDDMDKRSLEKVLGHDGLQTFEWLKCGFERAKSVGAVLTRAQRRIGTCFVIEPREFGLEQRSEGRVCLMTNYHVLNRDGVGNALSLEEQPKVRFEGRDTEPEQKKVYKVRNILFESRYGGGGLDCTVFTIDGDGDAFAPIPVESEDLPGLKREPLPRVYLIGYPLGGEMQFSLQDNRLLDHEGPTDGKPPVPERVRVHYFAPTEPGNSGSPVFDEAWNCIALHHAGLKDDPDAGRVGLQKLNGEEGHYSANEGFWIGSIIAAIAKA